MGDDGTLKYTVELDAKPAAKELSFLEQGMAQAEAKLKSLGASNPAQAATAGLERLELTTQAVAASAANASQGVSALSSSMPTLARGLAEVAGANSVATTGMLSLGGAMGGPVGMALVLGPAVIAAGVALYEMASGEAEAKKQAEELKTEMGLLDGVLKGITETMAKASEAMVTGVLGALGHDAKVIDSATKQLKSHEEAQKAVNKAKEDAAVSQLQAEQSAKLMGVTGKDSDLQEEKIKLEYAQKIADVRRNADRQAADAAVDTAKMQEGNASAAVNVNARAQENLRYNLEQAEERRRQAIARTNAASAGSLRSDQQRQLDRLAGSHGQEHDALIKLAPILRRQIQAGDVTFNEAKKADPLTKALAGTAEAQIATANAEIKKFSEELKRAQDASAGLTQSHRSAGEQVRVAEAESTRSGEHSKAVQADLDRQTMDLSRKIDQRKAKEEEATRKAKRDADYQQREAGQKKENESIQEFVQRMAEFTKTQHAEADHLTKRAASSATIHGYDPARAAMEAQARSLEKSSSPEALRAIAHKFFTPALLAIAQQPTAQGRFVRQQVDHVQQMIASSAAHGKQIAHDLGFDKQGHKVVARVGKKPVEQKDPIEEGIRTMTESVNAMKSLLEAKLTVF